MLEILVRIFPLSFQCAWIGHLAAAASAGGLAVPSGGFRFTKIDSNVRRLTRFFASSFSRTIVCYVNVKLLFNLKAHLFAQSTSYFTISSIMAISASIFKDLKQLIKPYYLVNAILSISFLVMKTVSPICLYMFPPSESQCELNMVSFTDKNIAIIIWS